MRKRPPATAALLTTLVALGATGVVPVYASPKHETHRVAIAGMKFNPDSLEVHAGDTVVWTNQDLFGHTVTADDHKTFDSREIPAGQSWRLVAKKKGTFPYSCSLHPTMKGTLTVK